MMREGWKEQSERAQSPLRSEMKIAQESEMKVSLDTVDMALFDQVTLLQKLYVAEVQKNQGDSRSEKETGNRVEAVAALGSPEPVDVQEALERANRHKRTLAQARELLFDYESELDGISQKVTLLDDKLKKEKAVSRRLEDRIRLLNTELEIQQRERESEHTAHVLALFEACSRANGALSRRKARKAKSADHDILQSSSLFDADWYLSEYSDVATAGLDPIKHYLNEGAREGRNPSTRFNTIWYLTSNPDVVQVGMNPLLHYLRYGMAEERQPLPVVW